MNTWLYKELLQKEQYRGLTLREGSTGGQKGGQPAKETRGGNGAGLEKCSSTRAKPERHSTEHCRETKVESLRKDHRLSSQQTCQCVLSVGDGGSGTVGGENQ